MAMMLARTSVGRSSKPLEDGARGIGESCCRACRDRQRVTEDEKKKKSFGETHDEKKRVAYQLVLYYSDEKRRNQGV